MRDPIESIASPADPEAQAEDERKRLQRQEDFKWLLAHAQGRRIVSFLFEQTGVDRSSFHHSGSVMAFNEGRRNVGVMLMGEVISASPEAYVRLIKECLR